MPEISKITLPSGTTYDLKDATARSQITTLQEAAVGGMHFAGILDDTQMDAPRDGEEPASRIYLKGQTGEYTLKNGDLVLYKDQEFVYSASDNKFYEMGQYSEFGDLAWKDTASTKYTPAGSVSQPTFTGSESTVTITATNNTSGNYTPAGTISGGGFTGESTTFTGKFTPAGTIATTTATTENKTATVSSTTGTATYTPAGTVAAPTFTGSAFNSTGNFTPVGAVSLTTENKTYAVTNTGTGNVTYTPAGTVSTPTISVKTAGTTTTIKNPTSATVAKTIVAAAPGATAPANNLTYYAVSNETLSLYQIGYTTGASITTANVTVKTGDAAYQNSQPTFSGTGAKLVTGAIPIATSASFTGTEGDVTVSGTATGTVSAPTFTGTGVRLVTGNIAVPKTYTSTFTGTQGDVSVSGTPLGSNATSTFSGTKVLISGKTTAAGTVSKPTFTGTQATITVS